MRRVIRPERVMAAGFLGLIVLGGVLLALPISAASGESIGPGNAFFTAVSVVCVTGLAAVDTGTAFSMFGQAVLLGLIQVGGLGFMIFATLILAALGKRITLQNRVLIRESMNAATLSGLVRLTVWYGLLALGLELTGAVLLAIRLVPCLGWARGLWYSLWHAVSAFCNAGFDLFGGFASLTAFRQDPLVLLTMAGLIILGGLGFAVMLDAAGKGFRLRKCTLHTRIALTMTGALLLLGTALYALIEWRNPLTLGAVEGSGDRLLNAFFQSVTMRTAGFSALPAEGMGDCAKLLSVVLMFVGASSASTGGGVKVTTMAVLVLTVRSVLRGEGDVSAGGRRLPAGLIRRALTIVLFCAFILLAGTMALSLIEGEQYALIDLLFEAASALATVGVSSIGTPKLRPASKAVLAVMMYLGRVGPLTMALALAGRQERGRAKIRCPEETIPIG